MQSQEKHRWTRTLGGQLAVLTLVMVSMYFGTTLLAWWLHGSSMVGVVALAAGICYGSAVVALVGERYFSRRHFPSLAMFWGMMNRSGVPLAAIFVSQFWGGPLAQPVVLGYLGAFYLGGLIVDVGLSFFTTNDVPYLSPAQRPVK